MLQSLPTKSTENYIGHEISVQLRSDTSLIKVESTIYNKNGIRKTNSAFHTVIL